MSLTDFLSAFPESLAPADVVDWIVQCGTDYALEYSLQTGMTFIQTACAVVGVSGATLAVHRAVYPKKLRYYEPLYRRLHGEMGEHLRWHSHAKFGTSPYAHLTRNRAVILQGRIQEGKTTLLRTAIPALHRYNTFGMKWLCWQGLYFNGAEACRNSTWDAWVTSQMFGGLSAAGSELKQCLWDWRQSQWFRLYMEILWMPFLLPRPLFIIVDQFEEVLKRYPEQAVPWADAITNYHVRNNLARVIFVVNSEEAVRTLHNLDWRGHTRFTRVTLEPLSPDHVWKVPSIDPKLFAQCECNIGLYHIVSTALRRELITTADVPTYVRRHLTRWELEFQLPFPQFLDPTWFDLDLPEAKRNLLRGLEGLLEDNAALNEEDDSEDIASIMAVVRPAVMRLDARQFYQTTQSEWREVLSNQWLATPGLSGMDANVMAKHVKRLLSNPVGWR